MVTATIGWGLAGPPTGGAAQAIGTAVVRTKDGGRNWKPVLLTDGVVTADFHGADSAWVALVIGAKSTGSQETLVIASTSDAGVTWHRTPERQIDGVATRVQFVDRLAGWIFAQPSGGGAVGSEDTSLYRTVDGGEHWQVIKPASQARRDRALIGTLPEECPGGGPIGAPVFINARTGWLGAFCNRIAFYVTSDGGLTWSPQDLPAFPGGPSAVPPADLLFAVSYLANPPADTFVAFVHRGITTGANALQDCAMYVSHDAGHSWTAYRLPYAELAADFIDSDHGWMVGAGPGGDIDHRSLYLTTDGGRDWRLATGPAEFLGRELNFVDPNTGFVASGPVKDQPSFLMRTTDRGATWQAVPVTIA
jgi:photosystem II stability/assembly factor-like uncharacterized protein